MSNSIYSKLYNKFYFVFCVWVVGFCLLYPNSYSMDKTNVIKADTILTVNEQADSLKKYGELILRCQGKDKLNYENLFFKYFPDTFQRFDSLYDFVEISPDSINFMPLYNSNHIEKILPYLDSISKKLYYKKLIGISIGADGAKEQANGLQNVLIKKVRDNLDLTVTILKELNDKKIKSFWLFFFDMENPSAVDFTFLKNVKDKRMIKIIKQARKEDKIKWSNE